jgi:hypothetical protein
MGFNPVVIEEKGILSAIGTKLLAKYVVPTALKTVFVILTAD